MNTPLEQMTQEEQVDTLIVALAEQMEIAAKAQLGVLHTMEDFSHRDMVLIMLNIEKGDFKEAERVAYSTAQKRLERAASKEV